MASLLGLEVGRGPSCRHYASVVAVGGRPGRPWPARPRPAPPPRGVRAEASALLGGVALAGRRPCARRPAPGRPRASCVAARLLRRSARPRCAAPAAGWSSPPLAAASRPPQDTRSPDLGGLRLGKGEDVTDAFAEVGVRRRVGLLGPREQRAPRVQSRPRPERAPSAASAGAIRSRGRSLARLSLRPRVGLAERLVDLGRRS